jgi:hypothetical protein
MGGLFGSAVSAAANCSWDLDVFVPRINEQGVSTPWVKKAGNWKMGMTQFPGNLGNFCL